MNTSARKAKGRRLAQKAKDMMLEYKPDLHADDIVVTSSGDTGEDLKLSPKARECFPFAIECKNQESLNFWKSFEQAKAHVKEDRIALLIASRNRSDVLAILKFEDLLKLIS